MVGASITQRRIGSASTFGFRSACTVNHTMKEQSDAEPIQHRHEGRSWLPKFGGTPADVSRRVNMGRSGQLSCVASAGSPDHLSGRAAMKHPMCVFQVHRWGPVEGGADGAAVRRCDRCGKCERVIHGETRVPPEHHETGPGGSLG
jgi:hypothetical protein